MKHNSEGLKLLAVLIVAVFCVCSCGPDASEMTPPHSMIEVDQSLFAKERVVELTDVGLALFETNKHQGVEVLKMAISIDSNVYSYVALAHCYKKMGKLSKARDCYEVAIQLTEPLAREEGLTWNVPGKRMSNIPVFSTAYSNVLSEYKGFLRDKGGTGNQHRRD